jgi:hypothetical protein
LRSRILSILLTVPLLAYGSVQAEIEFSDDLSDLTPAERAWLEGDGPRPDIAAMQKNTPPQPGEDDFPTRFQNKQVKWLSPEDVPQNDYYLVNHLILTPDSLAHGWVTFEQCHHQLDALAKIDIVYNSQTTRGLTITRESGIASAKAGTAQVTLSGIEKDAEICIEGQSRTLRKASEGWVLERGPYMRKFFNGYYPMHLKETLNWSQTDLTLSRPASGHSLGRHFEQTDQNLTAKYWFEGELRPVYQFKRRSPNP